MAKKGAAFYNKLSTSYMSDLGFSCNLVEKYNHHSMKKSDFLGFIDYICIGKNDDNFDQIVGLQSTSGTNHSNHRKKILRSNKFPMWVRSKHRTVLLLTFSKKIKPGCKKQKTYQPRAEWLTIKDWKKEKKIVEQENRIDPNSKLYKALFNNEPEDVTEEQNK